MAKIIAFAGSPRRGGSAWLLLDELIKGVESGGGGVKVYDLNDPGFRGCQGCFYCRSHPDCSVRDILTPFYSEINDATGVVFVSPIYFGDIIGQGKMWLDRMFPMLVGEAFQPRHPGKRAVTIFTQGDADTDRFSVATERLHGFVNAFGWTLEQSLMCAGTSVPGFTVPGELLGKAFAAGKGLTEA